MVNEDLQYADCFRAYLDGEDITLPDGLDVDEIATYVFPAFVQNYIDANIERGEPALGFALANMDEILSFFFEGFGDEVVGEDWVKNLRRRLAECAA